MRGANGGHVHVAAGAPSLVGWHPPERHLCACQASFGALETLGALRELVGRCLAPDVRAWSLYTTPPKQARGLFHPVPHSFQ